MKDLLDHIIIDPARRSGKPCIRGTRITVYDVLEYLAGGMSTDELLSEFPELTRDDVQAVLQFAAARERRLASSPRVKLLLDQSLPRSLLQTLGGRFAGSEHTEPRPKYPGVGVSARAQQTDSARGVAPGLAVAGQWSESVERVRAGGRGRFSAGAKPPQSCGPLRMRAALSPLFRWDGSGAGHAVAHAPLVKPLPLRTAWHVINRIREAWEDHTGTEPAPPQEPEQKQGPARPRSMRYPAPIPDSPENIAKALMSGPPKKEWRYLEGDENKQ